MSLSSRWACAFVRALEVHPLSQPAPGRPEHERTVQEVSELDEAKARTNEPDVSAVTVRADAKVK